MFYIFKKDIQKIVFIFNEGEEHMQGLDFSICADFEKN